MRTKSGFRLLLTACLLGQTAWAVDLSGVVKLPGTPPPEKEIVELKNDATCGTMYIEMP
jgi:hypothetical protein